MGPSKDISKSLHITVLAGFGRSTDSMSCFGIRRGLTIVSSWYQLHQGPLGHPYRACHLSVGDSLLLGHKTVFQLGGI